MASKALMSEYQIRFNSSKHHQIGTICSNSVENLRKKNLANIILATGGLSGANKIDNNTCKTGGDSGLDNYQHGDASLSGHLDNALDIDSYDQMTRHADHSTYDDDLLAVE